MSTKSLREKILSNTLKNTNFYDVAEPYNVLNELHVEVTPMLEEIDFYGGKRAPDDDYSVSSINVHKTLLRRNKSRNSEVVDLPHILEKFDNGQISFTGPAGSGKTTLLKSICQNVIAKNYVNLGEIDLVHYLECKNLHSEEILTPETLLFGNQIGDLTKEEVSDCASFTTNSPRKVLFVIDSLDTLPYTLSSDVEITSAEQEALPSVILSSLLSGKLFPGIRIITSSREHTIRNYDESLRAKRIVALAGLTKDSIKKIIVGYLGNDEADDVMKYLETKSPSLMTLCSTPIFLVYTLVGLKSDSDFKPSTMSGIMILLLQNLIRSEHARVSHIQEVIQKLEYLSFIGSHEGRVLFDTDELEKYHLKMDDVTDLTIVAPKGRYHRLAENHHQVMFFSHLAIQETLAAFHISKMDLEDFKSFVSKHIHSPHYSVIRRILCGIMLDAKVTKAATDLHEVVNNLAEKQAYFKHSMIDQVRRVDNRTDQQELYISFHEAKSGLKDEIRASLQDIRLSFHSLSPSDIHAIGSLVSYCKKLRFLQFWGCNLDSTDLEILASAMAGSDVEVTSIILSGNTNLGIDGMSAVGRIANQCCKEGLYMNNCYPTAEELESLKQGLGETKIRYLSLSVERKTTIFDKDFRVKKVGDEDMIALVRLIPHVTDQMDLGGWELTNKHKQFLKEGMNQLQSSVLKIYLSQTEVFEREAVSNKKCPASAEATKTLDANSGGSEIGPEGGVVETQGCIVVFPPGAVEQPTRFRIIPRTTNESWPEGYVGITPILSCEPAMEFPLPVKVTLPAWCTTNSEHVFATVMRRGKKDSEPRTIQKLQLKNTGRVIEFETTTFSDFWAWVRSFFAREISHHLTMSLHYDLQGNFTTAIHSQNFTVKLECRQDMEYRGFKPAPVMLDPVTIRAGDRIKIMLECQDLVQYTFDPEEGRSVDVDGEFGNYFSKFLEFKLISLPFPKEKLQLACVVTHRNTNRSFEFNLVWPETVKEKTPPMEDAHSSGMTVYGDVNAENLVIGKVQQAPSAEDGEADN